MKILRQRANALNLFPLLTLLTLCALPADAQQTITADHPQLLYTGRIDFENKQSPRLSWPGSSVRANFTGTTLSVLLDDDKGQNFYNVIVDGNTQHPYVLQAKAGQHQYEISRALDPGIHSVEIYKRTEGENGATAFNGLVLADSGKLLPAPKRAVRRMEIFGDSISCAMGNEGADNGADHLAAEENHYWSYGAVAARKLNTELHTICKSGIGIMVSWFPFTMPEYYDQLNGDSNNDSQWDFNRWTPDVVVINLLQNDSWLIDREQRLHPSPSDTQRVEAYVKFVRSIRSRYPHATIICALGSMDATATEKWPDYIREAVAEMRAEFNDKNLHHIFFDYTGYGQHPRVAQHVANGEKLAVFIREKMDW
ncbi:SGNH/GDSL hydrolase family protein [Microbulbifer bruguierae]|uniref:SGNH/GDSL hydrolase family protein n=1 Tax=Microbulbifer bruguierae TaxID=3029061 RepID=A0ABY8NBF6_9GAMM|nr:SGNH/GDSL hydrolase family protein [Microbulbifer bruguierae]WGL16015.1 SGNH/GDSL hydrolase family protein [Microbulbifer bruguierae]